MARKVITGFHFVKIYCSNAKRIIVADDDALILPWNLFSILNFDYKSKNLNNDYFAGFFWKNMEPIRDSSSLYYVSTSEFNCTRFPPYPSGTVYVLSYNIVVDSYHLAHAVEYGFTDDVFLGISAKLRNTTLTEYSWKKFSLNPSSYLVAHTAPDVSKMIAFHGLDTSSMQEQMWTEVCFSKTFDLQATLLLKKYCSLII